MADICNRKHILKRYRLTANQIGSRLYTNESHSVCSNFLNALAQVLKIEIALERIITLWQQTFWVQEFFHGTAKTGDMRFRSGKVEIHKCHHTRLDKSLGKDILACSSLMCRQDVFCTKNFFHSRLYSVEGFGASISIIGLHHGTKLQIGHAVNTRIGQHIHIYILILEQERIVACLLNFLQSVFYWQKRKLLNHSHLVHFEWHLVFTLIKFYCHLLYF